MSGGRRPPGRLVRLLVELLVLAYPRRERRRFGADMREAHLDAWSAEARGRGPAAGLRFWLRAAGSAYGAGLAMRLRGTVDPAAGSGSASLPGLELHARLALRGLARAPALLALAVLTLGVGIGGTTGLLAVSEAALRRPLPFPDADAIYRVTALRERAEPVPWPISHPDFVDLTARTRSFASLAVRSGVRSLNVRGPAGPRSVSTEMVSANYFEVLGVAPIVGRTFGLDEDAPPEGSAVALVSNGLAARAFGTAAGALGSVLQVNDLPYTVVGVMPPAFEGETGAAELWLPVHQAAVIYDDGYVDNRRLRWLTGVGRARAGAPAAEVLADVAAAGRAMAEELPDTNGDLGMRALGLRDAWYGELRTPLFALLAGAGLALLVVCLNVSSVQISRGLARREEADVCRALGAPRATLLGRWAVEAAVLAGLGLASGLAVAWAVVGVANGPARALVRAEVVLGPGVLGTAIALSVAAAGVLWAAPALSWTPGRQGGSLALGVRSGAGTAAGARARRALVVGQVALTTALCAAAVLLGASVRALYRLELGYEPAGVVAARVDLLGPTWEDDPPKLVLARELSRELEAVPGVASAALAGPGGVPTGELYGFYFAVEQDAAPAWMDESELLSYHLVTPSYFETLGLELLEGRLIDGGDVAGTPGAAVVTRSLARRFWPAGDELGRRLRMGSGETAPWFTVVGTVADPAFEGRTRSTELDGPEHVFLPFLQEPPSRPARMHVVLRSAGPGTDELASAVRSALARVAPALPLQYPVVVADLLADQTARDRFLVWISIAFASLALVLASLGVHSVIAHDVRRRRHELGVRMALGASPRSVVHSVVGESASLTLAGLGLGVLLAIMVGRMMEGLLFGVPSTYPAGLALVLGMVAVSALLASVGPARTAVRTDAARVLAEER